MKNYIEQSRKHFNSQAKEYDQNTKYYFSGPGKISCADTQSYLKDIQYDKLLDIGCGTGWLLNNLSEQHQAEYYGIDLSENMIDVAKSKNILNASLCLGNALDLPYDDEIFDVVTCIQSFHHYPDSMKAMKEAYRVLKKGGMYILSDTGVGGFAKWFDNNILFKLLKSGDCVTDNRQGISAKMEISGFKVIRCEQIEGLIYTVVGIKEE